MSWLQVHHNPHLIGICSIAAVSIIAFWGFGLAEKVLTTEKIPQVTNALPDSQSAPITQNPIISSASADVESNSLGLVFEKRDNIVERPVKPVSHLESLEKREFRLSMSGTYYAGSPSASKPAGLDVKVRPIQGTNLENFEVIEAKMMFDNLGIQIEYPLITIIGNDVYLTFVSDTVGSFVVKGVLDEPILSDKNDKQTIVIENQQFYLEQKDMPYRIDLIGIVSSS